LFTSPLFSKTTLHLAQDKIFTITASSNRGRNFYVQSRRLNGAEDSRTWITHQVLLEGGELHMEMGPYANMRAVRDEDLPYSASR
jgi:putative alpha-1,2-mannosidase